VLGGLLLAATGPRVTFVVAGAGGVLVAVITGVVLAADSRKSGRSGD
jgi:hypothetical protein